MFFQTLCLRNTLFLCTNVIWFDDLILIQNDSWSSSDDMCDGHNVAFNFRISISDSNIDLLPESKGKYAAGDLWSTLKLFFSNHWIGQHIELWLTKIIADLPPNLWNLIFLFDDYFFFYWFFFFLCFVAVRHDVSLIAFLL